MTITRPLRPVDAVAAREAILRPAGDDPMRVSRSMVAVGLIFLTVGIARSGRPRATRCTGGRFIVASGDEQSVADLVSGTPVIVELQGRRLSFGSCTPVSAHLKVRRRFTAVRARWSRCGGTSGLRLSGRIAAPASTRCRRRSTGGLGRRTLHRDHACRSRRRKPSSKPPCVTASSTIRRRLCIAPGHFSTIRASRRRSTARGLLVTTRSCSLRCARQRMPCPRSPEPS